MNQASYILEHHVTRIIIIIRRFSFIKCDAVNFLLDTFGKQTLEDVQSRLQRLNVLLINSVKPPSDGMFNVQYGTRHPSLALRWFN